MPGEQTASNRILLRLGHRIRGLRGDHDWTLRDLAVRSGLSERFLGEVEAGRGNISVKNLALIADALGTTLAALLEEKSPEAKAVVAALLGLRGAGKSTIGQRIARRLKLPFMELDRRVEKLAGISLEEIFDLHGQEYYRRLERDALLEVLEARSAVILAVGGGLVTQPTTYALLRARAFTLWLRADPEDHWNRVVQQGDRRPMAMHPDARRDLRRLLVQREPLYALAHVTIDTSRLGLAASVTAATRAIRSAGIVQDDSPQSHDTTGN